MSFVEVNLFGVYVAPISVIMVAAWLAVAALRRMAARFGLLRHVWHPNLLAQLGDYATSGQKEISLINADSCWVDGYFEETILGPIRVGDPVRLS
jgi:hypothetical protein